MSILSRAQNLPEKPKKIIFWAIIVIVGILLFSFWLKDSQTRFKNFKMEDVKKDFNFQSLKEEIKNIPFLNGEK